MDTLQTLIPKVQQWCDMYTATIKLLIFMESNKKSLHYSYNSQTTWRSCKGFLKKIWI